MTGGWQSVVDGNVLGTCAQAAVLGREGGVLAAGGGLPLTPRERAAAAGAFADPDRTRAAGPRIGGPHHTVPALGDQSIRLATEGGGAVLARSGTVLLLAATARARLRRRRPVPPPPRHRGLREPCRATRCPHGRGSRAATRPGGPGRRPGLRCAADATPSTTARARPRLPHRHRRP